MPLNCQTLEGCYTYKSESICYNEHRGDPEASKNEKENKTRPRIKCEKMENKRNTGYIVYDFMRDSMALGGVTLQVYALIYSFTKAGGDCHASINNIAKRLDTTHTSVKRALKELMEKNYIIKTTNNQSSSNHYVANMDRGVHNVPPSNEEGEENVPGGGTLCSRGENIAFPNNKDNNKGDNNNINELNIHSLIKEYWKDKPRPIQAFGSKKVVMMTLHQYANLLRAVGVKPTLSYVRLLENRITKGMFPVKDDHYQQIIDWAREDGRVTPEGEEILKN